MNTKNILRVAFALIFSIIFLPLSGPQAVSGYAVDEINLDAAGQPYEINKDAQGWLWVSDYGAGEVRGFNPAAGTYQSYPVGGKPTDARRIGTDLWWSDGASALLGKASTATGAYTIYKVPNPSTGLYATTADASGNFWASDNTLAKIYKIIPPTTTSPAKICPLALPDSASVAYMTADGTISVWAGDLTNGRLIRVNTSTGAFTWWTLPPDADPYSLAVDADGHIWYSDNLNFELAELNLSVPAGNPNLRRYALPNGGIPHVITVDGTRVWYTDTLKKSAVLLIPDRAAYTEFTSTATDVAAPAPWSCPNLAIASSGNYVPWPRPDLPYSAVSADYSLVTTYGGWKIIEMPLEANLWGVAAREGQGWVVDYGRKKLLKIDPPADVASITACKLRDADGSTATTNDRTPVAGWGMTLYKGGVSQGQQVTGADGCYTWSNQPVGFNYKVIEEIRAGWKALGSTECDKGLISVSGSYACEFVNAKEEYKVFLPLVRR